MSPLIAWFIAQYCLQIKHILYYLVMQVTRSFFFSVVFSPFPSNAFFTALLVSRTSQLRTHKYLHWHANTDIVRMLCYSWFDHMFGIGMQKAFPIPPQLGGRILTLFTWCRRKSKYILKINITLKSNWKSVLQSQVNTCTVLSFWYIVGAFW